MYKVSNSGHNKRKVAEPTKVKAKLISQWDNYLIPSSEGGVSRETGEDETADSPGGGRESHVAVSGVPLWGQVDISTLEPCVGSVCQLRSGPEVDQFDVEVVRVNEKVLVFQVPVVHFTF